MEDLVQTIQLPSPYFRKTQTLNNIAEPSDHNSVILEDNVDDINVNIEKTVDGFERNNGVLGEDNSRKTSY